MFSTENWAMLQRAWPGLAGYAFAVTQDQVRSGALVQEAILTAMERHRVPGDETAFRIWLFRILRPLCLPDLAAADPTPGFSLSPTTVEEDPFQSAAAAPDLALNPLVVRQGLFALSAGHRESLALIEIAGFGYEEAGRVLDISRAAMAVRLAAAREALLAELEEANVVPFPHGLTEMRHE